MFVCKTPSPRDVINTAFFSRTYISIGEVFSRQVSLTERSFLNIEALFIRLSFATERGGRGRTLSIRTILKISGVRESRCKSNINQNK